MIELYRIVFTDLLNQRVLGGQYLSFEYACFMARITVGNDLKTSWQIIRTSDGVVLAQSKPVQP